jgi:hypothetical protein
MGVALLCLLLAHGADPAVDASAAAIDTVVVVPREFHQALAPWIAHREAQGHRIALASNLATPHELRDEIRRIAVEHPVRFLLLVGDADPPHPHDLQINARTVPTHYRPAEVNVRWGSEPEIATDNWYADLDDDRVPELAAGRLTADSPAELARMVEKILAYETCEDFGNWRRQVHFVAGLGGFGPVTDAVLEAAAKTLITNGVPAGFATTMTYGSWQSPYCPDPRQFGRVTVGRLNEGSLFWVYIGHGEQRAVDVLRVPGGAYPILSSPDARLLACRHGAPIACFLSCYSGAFDQPNDCLAEEMLRGPGGPVAVLCGTRMTMPCGMAVLGAELLDEFFHGRPATLGELIVAAKRNTMQTKANSRHRAALDAVANTFAWATGSDAQAERLEHLDLFHLLGDPLLRLPHPQPVELDVCPTALAGESIDILGTSPIAGACTIELVVRRDRLAFEPPARGQFDPRQMADYAAVYARANEPRLAAARLDRVDGPFSARLNVPAEARGACHVRVFVEGQRGCAVGAADVQLSRPTVTR